MVYPVKMVQNDERISTPQHEVDCPYREDAEGTVVQDCAYLVRVGWSILDDLQVKVEWEIGRAPRWIRGRESGS